MDALLPMAIVLALGGGVVGGPEALRLLLDLAGRSPMVDVAVCAFLVCAVTAPVLGAMLLARYIRLAGNAPGPATELFARVTLAVALAVIFVVAACLVAIPSVDSAVPGPDVAKFSCAAAV